MFWNRNCFFTYCNTARFFQASHTLIFCLMMLHSIHKESETCKVRGWEHEKKKLVHGHKIWQEVCRVKQKNSDYLERDASASLLFTTFTTACWTSNSSPHQPSYYYSVPPHFFRKESFFNFNCIFVASSRESKSPAVSVGFAVVLMPQKGEMKRENGCLFFWKKIKSL